MRLYIDDIQGLFRWLDDQDGRYVVLRGYDEAAGAFPRAGQKADVDFLIDAALAARLDARYGRVPKWRGVKSDFYTPDGSDGANYVGGPYFPHDLAEAALAGRVRHADGFFVPAPVERLHTLLYHAAYHKAETSGIDLDHPERSTGSKYLAEITALARETGTDVAVSLKGIHRALERAGYGIAPEALARFIRNDFAHHRKRMFYAWLQDLPPGEMNLFVIRRVAIRKGARDALLRALEKQYTLVAVAGVPWRARMRARRRMRGGKWRFGGLPHVAVVVFSTHPEPTTEADRKVHPFVFNRHQFLKRDLREWFSRETGTREKLNPIHSTDNEAEAIGHLGLFFSEAEQAEIFARVAALRAQLPAGA